MEIYYDSLPYPRDLIAALGIDNRVGISTLERAHIVVAVFKCNFFNTSAAWDVGYCLGYIIYASPEDIVLLKYCETALSRLGNSLASKHYDKDDLRPYGTVIIQPHIKLLEITIDEQIAFLESCYRLSTNEYRA